MHHFRGRMTQQESLSRGGVSSEALRVFSNRPTSHWDKLIRLHSAQKLSHPQHFLMPHAVIIARRLSRLKRQEPRQQLSTRLVSAFVFRDFYPPSTPHFLARKRKKASCNSSKPPNPHPDPTLPRHRYAQRWTFSRLGRLPQSLPARAAGKAQK